MVTFRPFLCRALIINVSSLIHACIAIIYGLIRSQEYESFSGVVLIN